MTYTCHQVVRFAHVDAAGIVFYPRYFEMINATVEDYFADVTGVDFAAMHIERRLGVPTVRLEADFMRPSRLGERLEFKLSVRHVSRSSAELLVEVWCGDEMRFSATLVLVCISLDTGGSEEWPLDMRPALSEAREPSESASAADERPS